MSVPKLRFKEFQEPWIETSLGEVTDDAMYGMNAAAISYDGTNKYIRITDIDEDSREFKPHPLTSPDGEIEDRYKLKSGDIVFARTGASVGKSYLYKQCDGNLLFAGFLVKFAITRAYPYFIYTRTLTNSYRGWINVMSMRSGQPGINAEELKEFRLKIPSIAEQTKIANFLTAVDEKISLLTQKCDLLTQYKKGVMQKIFSQELRFKDDDGRDFPEWEERELGDVFKVTRGNVLSMSLVTPIPSGDNKYPVFSSQTKNKGLAGYFNDFLYENCITWTTDGANAGDVNYRSGKFYCTNVCGVLVNNEGYANACVSEMINAVSKKFVSYVGNPKLMNNVMAKIAIDFPCVAEQTKIANFLTAIDDKITATQSQLAAVKQYKQGLLQQMFV